MCCPKRNPTKHTLLVGRTGGINIIAHSLRRGGARTGLTLVNFQSKNALARRIKRKALHYDALPLLRADLTHRLPAGPAHGGADRYPDLDRSTNAMQAAAAHAVEPNRRTVLRQVIVRLLAPSRRRGNPSGCRAHQLQTLQTPD
jgi:hypothetical protein